MCVEVLVEVELLDCVYVVVGFGGGIGGELVLRVLSSLLIIFFKVLIIILFFDLCFVVVDSFIVFVFILVDICGLNVILCEVFENVVVLIVGFC